MNILIIEDDHEIVEFVSLAFKVGWPGTKLDSTSLGEEGIGLAEKVSPDVILLDLGLPDVSGFEVLRQIRLFSMVPIIILTVRADETDIAKGLEGGADEYVVKPFGQIELLARVRAVLRARGSLGEESSVVCGPFRFSYSMHKLRYNGKEINLTITEGLILHQLAINAGKVVAHSSLAKKVWGEYYPGAADSLKVYIRRLREKLEDDPSQPQLILTKPSIGYFLARKN